MFSTTSIHASVAVLLFASALFGSSEGVKQRHDISPQHLSSSGAVDSRGSSSFLQQQRRKSLPSLEAVAAGSASTGLKATFPWYHTTEEIHTKAAQLVEQCNDMASMKTIKKGDVAIDVVTVKRQTSAPLKNKVFSLFGEHSRELISPETGLYLLKVLCGSATAGKGAPTGAQALEDSEFQLVLNGNPRSRKKVESGEYCLRENPNKVDLNRNWDEMWKASPERDSEVNPGPHPFSEPETQIFKELVTEFRPTVFLTVHSGTRGMYMPWAYDMKHLASRNEPSMMQILRDLDKNHCQCPFGAAGREVGYSCPGTCLDWVYDQLKTPYSFAFEIYTDPGEDDELRSRWQEKVNSGGDSLLQAGSHLGHPHFLDLFQSHASDFVQVAGRRRSEVEMEESARSKAQAKYDCFTTFNPDTKERYDATVQNWVAVYLEMAQMVNVEIQRNSTMIA